MTEKHVLRNVSAILCVFGLVAFVAGWITTQAHLVQGGGAVVAASLVAMTASIGLTSWADERRKARVEKQQAVYTELVQQLMSRSKSDHYDPSQETSIRAQVSTWGSRAVLTALGRWHEAYDAIVPIGAQGMVTLSEDGSRRIGVATAELVTAVRREIDSDDSTEVSEVLDALFNQPGRYLPHPPADRSRDVS
jgi:type II secretory pathway pseudopilin PulG